ncbi:MAG: lysine--tRNA ligase, partial [Thaumarchaeota archaeon]|nr:lysine--tRNA ligase [Nitrososphaerota archaeon]
PHPHHVKYEMFLDKGGKKISKSLGNVITAQKWLEYGNSKSILLLLYKRITGARELGFDDIPSLMNEYNEIEDTYFGRIKVDNQAKLTKLKGLYEYVNLLNPPKQSSIHINYRLLIELTKIFKEDRKGRVMKKLLDYGVIKNEMPEIENLIELAGNYSDEFAQQEKTQVELDNTAKKALKILVEALEGEEPEDIQNTIYQIAKSNDVQPKDFFKILYQIILGTSRGPKIGPFISDIGTKQVAKTISEHI